MKYKLDNRTNISNKTLHKIIKFCCPRNLTDFTITFKYCEKELVFKGSGGGGFPTAIIYISRKCIFPVTGFEKKLEKNGYIDRSIFQNKNELLVSLCSHELRHIWQDFVSKRDFNKKAKGQRVDVGDGKPYYCIPSIERDASIYARKKLLKWRKQCQQK